MPYELSNTELKTVENIKDIGVTIESKLNFDMHINKKVKKGNQMMGLIRPIPIPGQWNIYTTV